MPPRRSRARTIRSIAELRPDPLNANRGTARGGQLLAESLSRYGAGRSILADREGRVIAGSKTLQHAQAAGLPVRVVQTDGDELVVVQRRDLDLEQDGRARGLALADNRIAELDLSWDPTRVQAHVAAGIDLQAWWTPAELERLVGHGLHAGRTEDDAVVPLRSTTIRRGDLFDLGLHRLLCGDATDAADVAAVLAGETPTLLWTDPPYGTNYDAAWRVRAGGRGRHAVGRVANDDRADWRDALALFPGDVAYVWHGGLHAATSAAALTACGFDLRAQIIWVKPQFVLGRGSFHWQHECCWYGVRRGASSRWRGDRTQSTVWPIAHLNPFAGARSGEDARTPHSTQKPARLAELPLLLHTEPGDGVYDPFVGSGTAIIAAQKAGRHARAIELVPEYVQVALDRWEAYTGETARRHETSSPASR